MIAKAPTLAWLLTVLTSFPIGMVVTAGWQQRAAISSLPLAAVAVTVEIAFPPAATRAPTVTPRSTVPPTHIDGPADPPGLLANRAGRFQSVNTHLQPLSS